MGVGKGPRFNIEDIYIDYPFEDVIFRWDHRERCIYRKFYSHDEEVGCIPQDNRLWNDALLYGNEITCEEYEDRKSKGAV